MTTSSTRRPDIDALRVACILLLHLYHSARMFNVNDPWHVKAPVLLPVLNGPMDILHLVRMPLLMVIAGMATAFAIHRLASDKIRRGPAWGCGYPDASPLTQYSASSFAQPIRRVFGSLVFRAREIGEVPPPGSTAPARLTVQLRDLIWDAIYAPIAIGVGFISQRLNYLQFLTIRSYLTLVFAALVILLLVLAIWP